MPKSTMRYTCQNCGTVYSQWMGKCDSCHAWNTIVEENTSAGIGGGPTKAVKRRGHRLDMVSLAGATTEAPRFQSGINELDRVTGGGFVPGSALLIGGDPGIGKSTILLQAATQLANQGQKVVYISGEESITQIRLRAERLKLTHAPVSLAAETNVEDIIATLEADSPPALLVLDSIQTLWSSTAESAPGTVTQVRTAAQMMIRYAKKYDSTLILVGHVTKDGQIAGPRVVEHMVDGVFYFEAEGGYQFRILRAVKNRFGPTDEIGVFEMTDQGLREISNPSALFLNEHEANNPGTAVFAGMEGTRPILVEIQALVAPTSLGTPRRAVVGWDNNRLAMILAVLETHCRIKMAINDVYLNVAGGLRITEPAADLAVAAALLSSMTGHALPANSAYFGEISLSGTIRPVSYMENRAKEAQKLGFKHIFIPQNVKKNQPKIEKLKISPINDLCRLVHSIAGSVK